MLSDLGDRRFRIRGETYIREDLTLKNGRGKNLLCSHWKLEKRKHVKRPCVVFLHGNAGSRIDVLPYVHGILSGGMSLFAFDFAGCGKSDGLYITLGFFERDDVRCVSRYLKRSKSCSNLAIWGHSMGAATAQMYATMDPFVKCCVIDSPYCDIVRLCKHHSRRSSLYGHNRLFPSDWFVSQFRHKVFSHVKRLTGADLNKCKPALYLKHHRIPTLYLCARKDEIIPNDHVIHLYEKNPCASKYMIEFDGTHNQKRPKDVLDRVFSFLCEHLSLQDEDHDDDDNLSDSENISEIPIWKDPTAGNRVCKTMFRFLKHDTIRKKNAMAGKTLLQSALTSAKPGSGKLPAHRLTLGNVEWLELLEEKKKKARLIS